jgi:hypothetical protein
MGEYIMKKKGFHQKKSSTPLKGVIDKIKCDLAAAEHANTMVANLRKRKFDAHVAAGFSEAQALFLCKE